MSIGIYISYIVLGLSLAAPIGPVNAVRLEKGLKNGFWHAWIVGAGSMIADGVYMLIVYLGLVQFLDSPMIQTFLWLFGGFILLYSGIEGTMNANKISVTYIRSKESLFKCFFTGFIMSVSSPLSILFWLGIYGSVLAKTASSFGTGQLLVYSLMIFIGLGLWDIFVAGLTSGFRRFLTSKAIIIISMLSGLSLILFGIYFGYQGIASLFG
ncbi:MULTISPECIES: LysE family transporter [Bacillus]|uniref:LysE family transporter n=1 Tax=Bacillus TaxID=1386 RepID=UPI000C777936|nr:MULTISPECIES: LysE family transporter [Bacillus]MCP1157502.1 LysE family translocator [Bacillus infantis]PLR71855.1 amino acid transporter [Bacillus sp. UMB0728]